MWKEYNPNPAGRRVGDCAVRAVAKALGTDWETAYMMIVVNGYLMNDMPSSNSVWGSVLRRQGFYRQSLPDNCPDCYTVKNFCAENPEGTYVLGTGTHVVTAIDGDYYDMWDSGDETVAYIWYRKEENE